MTSTRSAGPGAPPPQGATPSPGPGGSEADAATARRRRRLRHGLSVLSAALVLGGVGLLAYPLLTDLYSEHVLQRGLEQDYADPAWQERFASGDLASGDLAADDPLTRMVIPDLDVDVLVVAGTSQAALRAGAGHYPDTALPGEEGNVGIAGHRTTYGRPLRHADELAEGAEVRLETPFAVHTYEVVAAPEDAANPCPNGVCWITHPGDWSVVDDLGGHHLTLTTCHPLRSDRQRLIVRAELVDTTERSRTGGTG